MTSRRPASDPTRQPDDKQDGTAGNVSSTADGQAVNMIDNDGEVPVSGLGAVFVRIAALIYDGFLLVAVLFIVTAILLLPNDGAAFDSPLYLLVVLLVGWVFFDWFWRHGGQTLGMRAWRVKLVDDGSRDGTLTRRRTFLRYVLGCFLFGVTLLTIPFDTRRRAMHDRLTCTRVVRVAKV